MDEWGRGKGYRDRVSSRNRAWFDAGAHQRYEGMVREFLDKEWKHVVTRLAGLFPAESTVAV